MSSSTYTTPKHQRFQQLLANCFFEGIPPPNPGFSIEGGPKIGPNESNGTYLILCAALRRGWTIGLVLIHFAELRRYAELNPDDKTLHDLRALMELPERKYVKDVFRPHVAPTQSVVRTMQ